MKTNYVIFHEFSFSSTVAAVSTQVMTCQLVLTDQQNALEAYEVIELSEEMESSLRSLTLGRKSATLKSSRKGLTSASSSVDSGLENEYTHVPSGLAGVYPSMWLKIKFPIEVDDASPNGMLSQSDFDAIMQAIQREFTSWQIFLETKRTTHYCRQVLPLTVSTDSPKHRIVVKVRFSAWVTKIDSKLIESAVSEVMNKDREFFVEVQTEKVKK